MSLELEARERRWVRARTVGDRAAVLVIPRRAEALLLLARPRLVRVSWSAWLDSDHEYSSGDTTAAKDPPPRLESLVRQAEALARGEAFYDDEAYWGGPPRSAMDPRLVVLDELADLLGVDRDALDAKTHEIGRRIERMLAEAMDRMRSAQAPAPAPARSRLGLPPARKPDTKARAPEEFPKPYRRAVCSRARFRAWVRGWNPEDGDGDVTERAAPGLDELQAADAERDLTIVRKALAGVARVAGKFSLPVVADLLIGERTPCLKGTGLDRVRTFGALSGNSKDWVIGVLNLCVREGLVEGLMLTDKGGSVMRGSETVELKIPEEEPLGEGWELETGEENW